MPPNETVDFHEPMTLGRQRILPGEIAGVDTEILSVPAGEQMELGVGMERQVIYFVLQGSGDALAGTQSFRLEAMCLFVPMPGTVAALRAGADTVLLRIAMDLKPGESAQLDDSHYPILLKYADCEKYRDYFKSKKTVSRTLVHPFTLPRFCMGSVETTGPDRIEPHAHPMLDQLFFSFSNNRCSLLIDGQSFLYRGNNILHIPLGCEHGVDAAEGDVVHYLWLDFFEDAKEMQYLVDVHKPVEG